MAGEAGFNARGRRQKPNLSRYAGKRRGGGSISIDPRIYIPPPPPHIHVCRSWVKTGDGGTRKTSHGFHQATPALNLIQALISVSIIVIMVKKVLVVVKMKEFYDADNEGGGDDKVAK